MKNDLDCTYIVKIYDPKTGSFLGKYVMSLAGLIGSDAINGMDKANCDCGCKEESIKIEESK
jgi:hypothetical protein